MGKCCDGNAVTPANQPAHQPTVTAPVHVFSYRAGTGVQISQVRGHAAPFSGGGSVDIGTLLDQTQITKLLFITFFVFIGYLPTAGNITMLTGLNAQDVITVFSYT